MDGRQLKAFIAVFEERNITGAARRLHLSQPALSGTIKSLEDLLGTQLFTREARGVAVTEAARILYPQARRILSQTDSMTRQFRHGGNVSAIDIGVEADIAGRDVAAFVSRARQAAPALFVNLLDGCQGDARLSTEDGRCEDELFLPMFVEPYVLATPAGGDADGLPWIVCPEHPTHQRLLPYYGAAAGAPAATAQTLALALDLVSAGLGACVAPESLARAHANVIVSPIDGFEMSRRVGLCYAVQALDKPVLASLVEQLRTDSAVFPSAA
ncbi:LysR family transcriptional regulator [Pandoraea sp. ISTKB]|uniref:LysR family transcriptional regulator n=1 Tax=Pandoraea sp. ISTKB TaxID=1586708 RepID=UPI0008479742|nr:LysR family transcriptional regulator [Pandoraea sp. ISTKB]ODP32208.1 LysR family transcriptional regulator [Pandoraea sp. ISTKB]